MAQVPPDLSILSIGTPEPSELHSPAPPPQALAILYEDANHNSTLIFPITPATLPESASVDAKQYRVIGSGNYSFPDGRSEAKFSLAGYFPGVQRFDPTVGGGGKGAEGVGNNLPHIHDWVPPEQLTTKVRTWMVGKTRLRYHAEGLAGVMDIPVYLNSYSFTKSGPAGDVSFTLECTEWRQVVLVVDNGQGTNTGPTGNGNGNGSGADEPEEPVPTTYSVLPGDTLSTISKRFLGDSGRWREIYDANTDIIGPDPNLILPGQELNIPGGTVADPDNDGYSSAGDQATQDTDGSSG